MTWSMPRSVLQIVAAVLAAACLGSFFVGIMTADAPARLPGERRAGESGAPIEAIDATPLQAERIEGPPPPPELTPEEKAKLEAEKKAKEEAARRAEAEKAAQALPTEPVPLSPAAPSPATPTPKTQTPPPEEPVF